MKDSASLFYRAIEAFEREYLLTALESRHWNRKQTARDLGISYRNLYYKIERFNLAPLVVPENAAGDWTGT